MRTPFTVLSLLLLCPSLLAAPQTSQSASAADASFKIAGTAVNALDGAPLSKARITVADVRNPANAASMITSENGRFEFTSVPAGRYTLQGARRGFLTTTYEQHEHFSTAIITGPGLIAENLILRLTPMARLFGRVLDEAGDPVRDAQVDLFAIERRDGLEHIENEDQASTDDLGTYEFSALPPGTYYLSVGARPWYAIHPQQVGHPENSQTAVDPSLDVAYPLTFYNGATDTEGATPITMKGGDQLQIDVHLSPVPALHVIIRTAELEESGGVTMPNLQKRVFDSMEFVQNGGMALIGPGMIEVNGIPPGKYTLPMRVTADQFRQSAELDLQKNGQEFTVAIADRPGSVNFMVIFPDGVAAPKDPYIGLQDSEHRAVAYQSVDTTGRATFLGATPGKYFVVAGSGGPPYSVARMKSQGRDIVGNELNLSSAAPIEVTAFLTGGVVTVEGFVKRGIRSVSAAMVVLVPKDLESHGDAVRRDQSDSDGSFVIRGVLPGSYTLIAIEDGWDLLWTHSGALATYLPHGQNLTIGALMRGSVHLPEAVEAQLK